MPLRSEYRPSDPKTGGALLLSAQPGGHSTRTFVWKFVRRVLKIRGRGGRWFNNEEYVAYVQSSFKGFVTLHYVVASQRKCWSGGKVDLYVHCYELERGPALLAHPRSTSPVALVEHKTAASGVDDKGK